MSKGEGYGWQNNAPPKDVHVLISRTCEYIGP